MSWRYQPVRRQDTAESEPTYALCEVYLDKHHKLETWSGIIWPSGNDIGQLQQDICRMLVDAYSWEPVKVEEMKAGMTFKKKVTMKQREALAKFIESADHNLGEAGT